MIQFSSNDKSVNISAGDMIWYDTGVMTLLFKRSSQDCESDFEDVDEIKCNQLGFCGPHQPRLVRTCLWGLIWELQKKIKHQIKVDMNRQLRARHVADKSNQSCPVHHLTSNKITSINNLLYDWLDFVCLVQVQGRRGGTTQFSQWLKLGQIALITSKTLL